MKCRLCQQSAHAEANDQRQENKQCCVATQRPVSTREHMRQCIEGL